MKCEEGVPIYRLVIASLLRSQSVVLVIVRIGGVFVFGRWMLLHQLLDDFDRLFELRIVAFAHKLGSNSTSSRARCRDSPPPTRLQAVKRPSAAPSRSRRRSVPGSRRCRRGRPRCACRPSGRVPALRKYQGRASPPEPANSIDDHHLGAVDRLGRARYVVRLRAW